MEGTSDYDLVMEWYLLHGEGEVVRGYSDAVGEFIRGLERKQLLKDITPNELKFTFNITPKALKLIKEHQNEN